MQHKRSPSFFTVESIIGRYCSVSVCRLILIALCSLKQVCCAMSCISLPKLNEVTFFTYALFLTSLPVFRCVVFSPKRNASKSVLRLTCKSEWWNLLTLIEQTNRHGSLLQSSLGMNSCNFPFEHFLQRTSAMTRGRVIYVNEFIFYTVRRRFSFIVSKTARKQYYLFTVH